MCVYSGPQQFDVDRNNFHVTNRLLFALLNKSPVRQAISTKAYTNRSILGYQIRGSFHVWLSRSKPLSYLGYAPIHFRNSTLANISCKRGRRSTGQTYVCTCICMYIFLLLWLSSPCDFFFFLIFCPTDGIELIESQRRFVALCSILTRRICRICLSSSNDG